MKENDSFKESCIIFGAGSGGHKVAKILQDLDYKVEAFIDNDEAKWGQFWEGIPIHSPQTLSGSDGRILIASTYEKEVKQQLAEMNLLHRVALKETYIMKYAMDHFNEIKAFKSPKSNSEPMVLISSETGFGHWGIEQYSRTVGHILKQHQIPFRILCKECQLLPDESLGQFIQFMPFEMSDYWGIILKEVEIIIASRPCLVMDNWQSYTLIAAVLAKRLCPDDIRILSVLHNDQEKLREIVSYFKDEIDYISAVSKEIIAYLQNDYGIPRRKLVYHESPILISSIASDKRYYEKNPQKPLRLAYGARLTKTQKRTHLLLPILDALENAGVNYVLDIAGAGKYGEELASEITARHLEMKVHFSGLLPNTEMPSFWLEHDIFINISDFEGAALSMLEAMAYGCVPVVTRVAGTQEFVIHTQAGFVRDLNDISGLAEDIISLEKSRDMLALYGMKAQKVITEKCGGESYYHFMSNLMKW